MSHNTLEELLTNPGCVWMLSISQPPSVPSPVPCGPTPMNPGPNTNTGLIKTILGIYQNLTTFPNIVIISHILISSDPNPVLPFLYTLPHFIPFASPLPPTLGYVFSNYYKRSSCLYMIILSINQNMCPTQNFVTALVTVPLRNIG